MEEEEEEEGAETSEGILIKVFECIYKYMVAQKSFLFADTALLSLFVLAKKKKKKAVRNSLTVCCNIEKIITQFMKIPVSFCV